MTPFPFGSLGETGSLEARDAHENQERTQPVKVFGDSFTSFVAAREVALGKSSLSKGLSLKGILPLVSLDSLPFVVGSLPLVVGSVGSLSFVVGSLPLVELVGGSLVLRVSGGSAAERTCWFFSIKNRVCNACTTGSEVAIPAG